jgi:hypothetical protein
MNRELIQYMIELTEVMQRVVRRGDVDKAVLSTVRGNLVQMLDELNLNPNDGFRDEQTRTKE